MQNHKNLTIWKLGMDLVKDFYALTSNFPKSEEHILVSQIRRSAISIPVNIAEGVSRRSDKDFYRFLEIALGASCELDTLLQLSFDLKYIKEEVYNELSDKLLEERKMIWFLWKN